MQIMEQSEGDRIMATFLKAAMEEIESLRQQNKTLLEYIDKQDLKNSQQVVDDRDDALIKSEDLRQQVYQLREDYSALQKVSTNLKNRGDEWKRRAELLYTNEEG